MHQDTERRASGQQGIAPVRARRAQGWPAVAVAVASLLASVGASGCAAARQAPAASRQDPNAREWLPLFNGQNLDGWIVKIAKHPVGVNHARTFRVQGGVIEARYDEYPGDYDAQFGHLYHARPYSHYIVSLEYRLVGQLHRGAPSYTLRNSGIMVHSQDPRTMPPDQNFPISIEMQFLGGLGDGRPRPTGNMCSPGTMVDFAGKPDPRHCINSTSRTFDGEQWVRAEAVVLGDSIVKHVVNGDTVLTYTRPRMAAGVVTGFDPAQLVEGKLLGSGFIALQAEGHPIDFRDVRLLNLEGCTDPRARNYKSYHVESDSTACRYDRPTADARRPAG